MTRDYRTMSFSLSEMFGSGNLKQSGFTHGNVTGCKLHIGIVTRQLYRDDNQPVFWGDYNNYDDYLTVIMENYAVI